MYKKSIEGQRRSSVYVRDSEVAKRVRKVAFDYMIFHLISAYPPTYSTLHRTHNYFSSLFSFEISWVKGF